MTFLADPISAPILAALPRGAERFVEHLNRTGRVTTTEAIELLGVSRPTAIRHLEHLVDAGLPKAVRKSPKDPRGYWRTVVEGTSTTLRTLEETPSSACTRQAAVYRQQVFDVAFTHETQSWRPGIVHEDSTIAPS